MTVLFLSPENALKPFYINGFSDFTIYIYIKGRNCSKKEYMIICVILKTHYNHREEPTRGEEEYVQKKSGRY